MRPLRGFRSFVHRNGLTLTFALLMGGSLVGHAVAGWKVEIRDALDGGQPVPGLLEYIGSGAFLSSLFENWESEFLQMALFVVLTVALRQRGSSESRPMSPDEEKHPRYPASSQPWPVRRGGVWRKLYEHSLSLALALLFLLSLLAHWLSSWSHHRQEALADGEPVPSLSRYFVDPQFWFESFQNWQSEFLAVIALVVLSIFLREKDSPQSKDVEAPHSHTGT